MIQLNMQLDIAYEIAYCIGPVIPLWIHWALLFPCGSTRPGKGTSTSCQVLYMYQAFGTKYLVPSIIYQVLGANNDVPSTRYQVVPGT